jgi:hypothetical protein
LANGHGHGGFLRHEWYAVVQMVPRPSYVFVCVFAVVQVLSHSVTQGELADPHCLEAVESSSKIEREVPTHGLMVEYLTYYVRLGALRRKRHKGMRDGGATTVQR